MGFERWLLTLPLRLRSLFRRRVVEAELHEELQFHLDSRIEEEVGRGATPAEARQRALRAFGGMDQHVEACRDTRRVTFAEQLVQDIRHGARVLRKEPVYAAIVIGTLGLAIGATTAVFSVVDGVLLRPVPFENMDRLVMVWGTDRTSGTVREPVSVPDFIDFQPIASRIGSVAAFHGADVNAVVGGGAPIRLAALAVTSEFLPLLGITPLVGRGFERGEDLPGGAVTVLIGESLWEAQFGRDAGVIGRTIELNEASFTIAGVVPRGADFGVLQVLSAAAYARGFADRGDRTEVDIWLPFVLDAEAMPRYLHPIFMIGRLAPGITLGEAQAAFASVAAELEQQHAVNDQRGVNVESLSDVVFGPVRSALLVLLGAVSFVLLVACANVANLMLARGSGRAREIAVRSALGATGTRLAKQFLVESMLLTMFAAAVGVCIALGGLRMLLALAPASAPRIDLVTIDLRVLAFTVGIAAVVGIVFGLLPSVQARRTDVQTVLRREAGATMSREGRRMRSGLVVAEVALAVVLLVGAGLLLRSFWNLQGTDPGFSAHGLYKAEFQLPTSRYPTADWPRLWEIHRFNDVLLERVAALPGVASAALSRNHPLDAGSRNSFAIIGREAESRGFPEISIRSVSPAYFRTVGMQVLGGRAISVSDATDAAPVMVINTTAARSMFPTGDAIGQRIAVWGAQRTIIGVVSDERIHGLAAAAPPAVYVPLAQVPPRDGNQSLLVRARGDVPLTHALRATFAELDPGLAVFGVEPLTSTVARSLLQRRFMATLLVVFSTVAVLLALIGIHALLSYTVAQRRREIGIRMALGADRSSILGATLTEGLLLATTGLVIGLLLAAALGRVLSSMLHGVGAADPVTLFGAAAALLLSAVLTCSLPARQASRTDPAITLKDS